MVSQPGLIWSASCDYPALYLAADKRSCESQKRYLLVIKCYLALLILAALSSMLDVFCGQTNLFKYLISFALTLSIVISLYLMFKKPESEWYGARAVAESVKTLCWRYMMGAEPFCKSLREGEADDAFLGRIAEIIKEKKRLAWRLDPMVGGGKQISKKMRAIRISEVRIKKEIYHDYRVLDQLSWYSNNAKHNQKSQMQWLLAIILCLLVGLFLSAFPLFYEKANEYKLVSFTPVLAALAASFMAWTQVKGFQELSQSYSIAMFEISIIRDRLASVTDSASFVDFIEEAEKAFSREHTLWVARRGKI